MIPLEHFLNLPTAEIAQLVRDSGPKVVVFPINGTRRWFILEYGGRTFADPIAAYTEIVIKRHIELYELFFDHGIQTLVTPVIGSEVLETRDDYMQKIGAEGLASLATREDFLSFYDRRSVRVRCYGDYRNALATTLHSRIIALLDGLTERTLKHDQFRLFFGVFADERKADTEAAKIAIGHFRNSGEVPGREDIVEAYYGEYVEKADIFIGFDRLAVFDYPFLHWGGEDLYFTITPSLYMTQKQLRMILYDHLFTRRVSEPDYLAVEPEALEQLRNFYKANNEIVLGIGQLTSNIWYPSPS